MSDDPHEHPEAPTAPEDAVTTPDTAPETEVVETTSEHETPAPPVGRRGRLLRRAGLLLLPVGLAVLVAVLLTRVQAAGTVADYYRPSSPPLEAARTAAQVLFSYDHRSLDEDFAAGAELSTGDFREDYDRTTGAVVREIAERYSAVVVAEPIAAGLSRAEPGRVVAVVFVNQTTTSTQVEGPQVDQSRVRMTLVERDGRWLVSAVDAL